jgi:hypothetical protein
MACNDVGFSPSKWETMGVGAEAWYPFATPMVNTCQYAILK